MAIPSQGLMQCKRCGEKTDTPHKTQRRLCVPCGKKRMVEAQRRYRERQKALCRDVECQGCGRTFNTAETGGKVWRCPKCLYEYHRSYREQNPEKDVAYSRAYRARQGQSYTDKMRQRRWDAMAEMTPEQIAEFRAKEAEQAKQKAARLKAEVFEAYGGWVCNCCGETEPAFLSMDHVNNDGYEMRQSGVHGHSTQFYRWLKNNGFPDGFQVLCMNCNFGKRMNGGVCPHQDRCND